MNRTSRNLAALLLLAAVAGCANGRNLRFQSDVACTAPMGLPGPDVQRQEIAVDVTGLPSLAELMNEQRSGDAAGFRALREDETRQLAAERSATGNLLARESDAITAQATKRGVDPLAAEVLRGIVRAVRDSNGTGLRVTRSSHCCCWPKPKTV